MQLSGSLSQSVLHSKRSHDNQPIGGVRASPLSKQQPSRTSSPTNSNEVYQLPDSLVIMYLKTNVRFLTWTQCGRLTTSI